MSSSFWYQPFVVVSGSLGDKIPVVDDVLLSHEQEFFRTGWLDEDCIGFKFQTYRKYYFDLRQRFLALKPKLVGGRGYEPFKTKEKKDHIEEAKADEEAKTEEEQEALIPLVTHVKKFQCWSVHQHSENLQL